MNIYDNFNSDLCKELVEKGSIINLLTLKRNIRFTAITILTGVIISITSFFLVSSGNSGAGLPAILFLFFSIFMLWPLYRAVTNLRLSKVSLRNVSERVESELKSSGYKLEKRRENFSLYSDHSDHFLHSHPPQVLLIFENGNLYFCTFHFCIGRWGLGFNLFYSSKKSLDDIKRAITPKPPAEPTAD